MVEYTLHAHLPLQLVESLCRHPFHHRVSLSRHLHAVHHVVARLEMVHHLRDGRQVVLQVRIDGHHRVRHLLGLHHARQDGSLVPHVAGQVHALHIFVLAVQLLDECPCAVAAAVIDKQHETVCRNLAFRHHLVEERRQSFHGVLQHLFLIITR